MTVLEQMLDGAGSVVILGHVRPDGDCLGSALGLYHYLQISCPDIRAAVYLEESSPKFSYLKGYDAIRQRSSRWCARSSTISGTIAVTRCLSGWKRVAARCW